MIFVGEMSASRRRNPRLVHASRTRGSRLFLPCLTSIVDGFLSIFGDGRHDLLYIVKSVISDAPGFRHKTSKRISLWPHVEVVLELRSS